MTFERLNHIRVFLESQRSISGIGPDNAADYPVDESKFTPLGLHVSYSYELCDAVEELMGCRKPITNPAQNCKYEAY
jgi:hypothetical protein